MKQISLILGVFLIAAIVATSGCTSNNSETQYSSFKTYNNSEISFEYPDSWIIHSENSANGVRFNSTNGQIRVEIYDIISEDVHTGEEVYLGRIFDSANYETKTVGNKTYRFVSENGTFAYAIDVPGDREFYVRGNSKDDEGLKKILETFQLN